jgi:molecular chaperone DnaK
MAEVFGIDLGTTNSVIARYSETDGAVVIGIDNGETVPSIVARAGNKWIVGKTARQHLMLHPFEGVSSIKRKMGLADYRVHLNGQDYSATEISSQILIYLKSAAEVATGYEVKDVVITVPAYFREPERQATIEAGKLAGLNVLRIINEPTAAALVETGLLQVDEVKDTPSLETFLVYDLGGGTFDVSIVESSPGMKEVIASSGDSLLGGDDFDALLVNHLVAYTQEHERIDATSDVRSMAFLRFLAEEVKISLSSEVQFVVDVIVPFENTSFSLKTTVTREEFEGMIKQLVESTIEKTANLLQEAQLTSENIDRLLLVGGSTRIPLVTHLLKKEFNFTPCSKVDPDLSVGLGAAVQAGVAVGKEYRNIVVDVAPHSLGIAVMGELDFELPLKDGMPRSFSPLINRNTRLPARFSETFYKMFPGQKTVAIHILQGESSLTYENTLLGKFEANVGDDDGEPRLVVTFEYTIDGTVIIQVSTGKDLNTITRHSLSVGGSAQGASDFVEIPDAVRLNLGSASNFLSRKVRTKLQQIKNEKIIQMIQQYEALLGKESDELDKIEDVLHDWLDEVG